MAIVVALTLVGCAAAQEQQVDNAENLNLAQVRYVSASQATDGSWRFAVSVEHRDEGWDHYADAWQVIDPESNEVITERILAHPHDNEQPFTRSQTGVIIPEGVTTVLVRARCIVHGFGGSSILVDLTVAEGDGYQARASAIDY